VTLRVDHVVYAVHDPGITGVALATPVGDVVVR
jgi:hypothetical protein